MSDNDDKAEWMRRVCATEAAWSPSGELLSLKLGPDTRSPAETREDRETQPSNVSPQERERRDRLERRRLVSLSSGGPVPKLDAELG